MGASLAQADCSSPWRETRASSSTSSQLIPAPQPLFVRLDLIFSSFAHLSPRLNVPIRTIVFTYAFNALFGLLYLGPSVAFSAYAASSTIFLNVSYVFPVIVLLLRGRGVLKQYQSENTYFALGWSGWVLNSVASIFVVVTSTVSPTPKGNLGAKKC